MSVEDILDTERRQKGLSVGSDRVDMTKIPGMLRKHSFPGSQTEEEGNKSFHGAWKSIYHLIHKGVTSHRPTTLQISLKTTRTPSTVQQIQAK